MTKDLNTLLIESLIFHQVPQAARGATNPSAISLTNKVIQLNDEQRLYMQVRLRESLSLKKQAREVQESTVNTSPVPGFLRELLLEPAKDFVSYSQEMANHLRKVQAGNSPSGLFMLGRCLWGGSPAIIIAKVELERGILAKLSEDASGNTTFDLSLLNDLVFGQTSKIYKIGLFGSEEMSQPDNFIKGIAVDEQIGGSGVTQFFLLDYLGCEFIQDASELTKRYYDKSIEFFSKKVNSASSKSKYMVALLSDLENRRSTIDYREFAINNLDDDDQQPYIDFLRNSGVTTERFSKATDYVSTQLIRYETDTNVIVIASAASTTENIVLVNEDSIVVKGHVNAVEAKGPKGARQAS